MRVLAIGFLLFLVGFCNRSALADPSSTPTTSARQGRIASPLELLEWEASIAETSYASQSTDRRFTALVSVYERIIAHACMPNLRSSLQYAGAPSDPTCLKYIDEVLKLDAENPMAICARDGIASNSCQVAFDAQDVGTFQPGVSPWAGDESMDTQLETKLEEEVADSSDALKINNQILGLEGLAQVSAEERAKYEPKMTALYEKLLASACKKSKLKIVSLLGDRTQTLKPEEIEALKSPPLRSSLIASPAAERRTILSRSLGAKPGAEARGSESAEQSPMDKIVKALSSSPDTSTQNASRVRHDGIVRIRLISQQCEDAIKRAKARQIFPASAVCAERGEYSPDCIRAQRKARSEPARSTDSKPSPTSKSSGGSSTKNFSTF